MDVLYSIGPDNGHDYFNLKMSLRSLSRYAVHVGKVVVAGYIPKWLSDYAIKFPYPAVQGQSKHEKILNTIFAVIDQGLVKGEFLYSSDDHFLIRRVNLDQYPYYYKQEKLPSFQEAVAKVGIRNWKGYYRSLVDTRSLLERHGYGIRMFNGHVNTHMDTEDALEVKRLVRLPPKAKDGYEPTCLFMNVRQSRLPINPTYREDIKIDHFVDGETMMAEMGEADTFSIADNLDENIAFRRQMLALYPDKSRFER